MSLPVIQTNNVRVYNVSGYGSKSLPDWLVNQHKKNLKKDSEWSRRVELLQDFSFPEAAVRTRFTPNQKYIVATGVYKPQFRVYELSDMSMKFSRHTNSDTLHFVYLAEDYTKLALLQSDRSIEIHTPLGMHHSVRIPKVGRDMVFDPVNCDLVCAASSSEVYRLNLDRGQFLKPYETNSEANNCLDISSVHRLYSFGGDSGTVEFWDPRSRNPVAALKVNAADHNATEISALKFLPDGLSLAVGTSGGVALLYDIRLPTPLLSRDHHYGFPIKSINYHSSSNNLITADKKSARIWNKDTNELMTTVEPNDAINDVEIQQDTGFMILSVEAPDIQSYYIPNLGPAPRWCAFLDNLTEEMEEKPVAAADMIYANYKFVTRKDLLSLSLDHLIGSSVLRAYMHGYFIDLRLYEKAKAIANPFAFQDYQKAQLAAKIEKEQASRIGSGRRLPGVNKNLAARLRSQAESTATSDSKDKKQSKTASAVLQDQRFADIFVNPDFEVDENSDAFRLLHPVKPNQDIEVIDAKARRQHRKPNRNK